MKIREHVRELVRSSVSERQRMLLSRLSLALGLRPRVKQSAAHSLPFPGGKRAALIISADLELAWAWRFARGVADPVALAHRRAWQGRRNLPLLLDLCDQYQLPVTWAVVGHLFLDQCDRANGIIHPELPRVPYFTNELWAYQSGDWFDDDPGLSDNSDPEWADWHGPDLIRNILVRPVVHEIGCHTFSHTVFSDRYCPASVAAAELRSCREAAAAWGLDLKSFVFSGNLEGNYQALRDAGFRGYRIDDWYELDVPRRDAFGLWRFNGGLCIDRPFADYASTDQVHLLRRGVDMAIERGLVCGLWFHPETHPRDVDEIFPAIFEHIASRREDLWVTTMAEMADWLDNVSGSAVVPTSTRQALAGTSATAGSTSTDASASGPYAAPPSSPKRSAAHIGSLLGGGFAATRRLGRAGAGFVDHWIGSTPAKIAALVLWQSPAGDRMCSGQSAGIMWRRNGDSRDVIPRIAILSNFPADHMSFTGGVETATAALVEGLTAHSGEFDFHLVATSTSLVADVCETRDGVSFHFIGGLHRSWVRPRLPLRVAKTSHLLRILRPDLVHCQGDPELALAAVLAGYRPTLTIHGVAPHEANLRTGRDFWSTQVAVLIGRVIARHVGAYICNSAYAASVAGRGRPMFAIPNAVSSVFFSAARPADPTAKPPCLVFVGVLAPLKRPADLLHAHAALRRKFPTLTTILCGPTDDEGYARRLQQIIAEENIDGVRFVGSLSHDSLAALLRGATALVLPSAQENAPMAIAEAMAIGLPVVATRVGGVPEMVKEGVTGLLYPPGDVERLIACLDRLLSDAALSTQLGRQARELALTRYTPAAVASETVAAYRHLLDATALPGPRPLGDEVAQGKRR